MSVYDPTTDKTVKYNVVPPYSDDDLYTPSANPTSAEIKRSYIDSSLLHRRMGHRSVPVLLHASQNNLWLDTKMALANDDF